jgi:cytochrome c
MDFFAWNRIVGALLGAAIFALGARMSTEVLFRVEPPEHPAYIIEGVNELPSLAQTVATTETLLPDFASAIPAANIDHGESLAVPCAICHTWEEGGANAIGPNLYDIIGATKTNVDGYNYSPAFQSLRGVWSYTELFAFLEQPSTFVPGTMMGFPGISNEQDRLDLIAYMRSWSSNPAPLP